MGGEVQGRATIKDALQEGLDCCNLLLESGRMREEDCEADLLCGYGPCEEIGCLLDKSARLRAALAAAGAP